MLFEIRMLARIDVARRTRMGLLVLLRLFLCAGKWTARSARSIKYAFIVLTPDEVASRRNSRDTIARAPDV
jgi:hypothetical protein